MSTLEREARRRKRNRGYDKRQPQQHRQKYPKQETTTPKPKPQQQAKPKIRVKVGPKKLKPRWKWSYNGPTDKLIIWPTDEWGNPHHVEVTGQGYYKFNQGRIYVYGNGPRTSIGPDEEAEIMVWDDRGSKDYHQAAIDKVNEWLESNFKRKADKIIYRNEYAWWTRVQEETDPDNEEEYPAAYLDALNDYYNDLKGNRNATDDDSYAATDYATGVGSDPTLEKYKEVLAEKPIGEFTKDDWDRVETYEDTKQFIWTYDGQEFHARQIHYANPKETDYALAFKEDGLWSPQGIILVKGSHVTLIIDSEKPYYAHGDPVEMQKMQNEAKDKAINWIKTILGKHVDYVKYSGQNR